jgi:hypothetical protein
MMACVLRGKVEPANRLNAQLFHRGGQTRHLPWAGNYQIRSGDWLPQADCHAGVRDESQFKGIAIPGAGTESMTTSLKTAFPSGW